ncbi:phosphatidylglycerophosphatase and protein-tyrosine phosphatase 1-like isoform X2 [Strongylocentrotus purpuratus]|uniref:Phosphatidylglycerophosphatase and protein-tyrosine phosphatase 1 n=1 Tax=Strongylocentrotus purpuratus TaxID=7668 RepID=A0A7M7PH58_STRPU|nr:phosphatidylglycerophosphatase and protein-tyrosine phosphatase 1 isoform X1 [Strongylocentrotus purpuratus]XP_030850589.1 phosphatidylglycerophosphatase and protein-tyrosine phosphatase 1-like isoform X1 [Strongylocentrotus purpuratus]XP_030850594.1 phosphatidylglycerophosphatase and protein-tyrosine phosphatase 1-like isoform X2 [Strongylocentrotus purpuratus]|eukprot:XP_001188241.1 PREDICTED: phosphatidylglycerophosphatase and protein-tyrosine phosphatase 1 [Strongylocentrotus purpuratus]
MGGSRALFYPTLYWNVFMKNVTSRNWYDRIDSTVILGALPFRSYIDQLKEENVKGVISLNEDHELRRHAPTVEEWKNHGIEHLQLPTVDFTEAPSLEYLERGVEFIQQHANDGSSVYVHCKAGRTRSATLVGCYLMMMNHCTPQEAQTFMEAKRPHILLKDRHFRALYRYYDKHVKKARPNKDKRTSEPQDT